MDYTSVYTQDGALLGVLDNAHAISYGLKHNDLWTAGFSLPADDPQNSWCQAHNLIQLPQDGRELGLYRIVGMPDSDEIGLNGLKRYNLEHVMATLLDDLLFGYHEIGGIGITTQDVIEYILNKQTVKRWQLGDCDFSDQFAYSFENADLLSALTSLGEVLDEEFTWQFDTTTTPWTVSLKKADAQAGCGIHYLRNMQQIKKSMDASGLVTRLYLLGYGEGINQLNITSVNGGLPYLDADTTSQWGIKSGVFADPRLEDADTLKARGLQLLEKLKTPYISYTASAIDLARMTGHSWDSFMPGKLVKALDSEHNIDFTARIVSVAKGDLLGRPGEITITIANADKDAAGAQNALATRVGIGELYSQGATNLYAQQYADNADAGSPAVMRVYIPSNAARINKVLLSWQLEDFRAYSTGAAAGGGQTSSEGGGAIVSSNDGGAAIVSSNDGGAAIVSSDSGGGEVVSSSDGGGSTPTSGSGGADITTSGGAGGGATTSSDGGGISETLSISSKLSGKSGAGVEVSYSGDTDSYLGSTNDGGTGYTDNPNKDYTGDKAPGATDGPDTDATSTLPSSYNDGSGWGQTSGGAATSTKGANVGASGAPTTAVSSGQQVGSGDTHTHSITYNNHYHGQPTNSHSHGIDEHYHTIGHSHTLSGHVHGISGTHWHSLSTHQHKGPNHSHVMNHKHSMGHVHTLSDHQHYIDHSHTLSVGAHSHTVTLNDHTHSISIDSHTHELSIPAHSHNVAITDHNHNVAIADHNHNVDIPNHSHDVAIPDHTHDTDDHTHDIVYGIYKGGRASAASIKVDGNLVPSGNMENNEMDLVPWLAKDSDGRITRGSWHSIEIIPNALTRIEANLFVQTFIQSRGGGDY